MAKRELSEKQQAFQDFFFNLMDEHEINSPSQLDEKGKIDFFNQVKKGWKKYKKDNFNENYVSTISNLISVKKESKKLLESYLSKI